MKAKVKVQITKPRFDVNRSLTPREPVNARLDYANSTLLVPLNIDFTEGDKSAVWPHESRPSVMWQGTERGGKWRQERNIEQCLEDFFDLANAPDKDILLFVTKYGPLNLEAGEFKHPDEGGRDRQIFVTNFASDYDLLDAGTSQFSPMVFAPNTDVPLCDGDHMDKYNILRDRVIWYFERTEHYRALSRQANAFFEVAAELNGQLADTDKNDWDVAVRNWQIAVSPYSPQNVTAENGFDFIWSSDVETKRFLFCELVSQWLRRAAISPTLRWQPGDLPTLEVTPQTDFGESEIERQNPDIGAGRKAIEKFANFKRDLGDPYRLFPLLTIQLMAALTTEYGIARCDVCHELFNPNNRQVARPGRGKYCSEKCRAKAHRVVEKESRERSRAKKLGVQLAGGDPNPTPHTSP